jgi:hypothetical protein
MNPAHGDEKKYGETYVQCIGWTGGHPIESRRNLTNLRRIHPTPIQSMNQNPDRGEAARAQVEISRRGFLGRAISVTTVVLLLAGMPARFLRSRRVTCRGCGAVLRAEAADQVVCCPNCGREWWTGGFALKDAFGYRFPHRVLQHPRRYWDYAQVPFPNFQLVAKSDKPVLSLKQMTFSGRRTTRF